MEMKTSGSTGSPRLIQHPKEAIEASALRTLHYFQLTPGARLALAMPAEFVGGMMMVIRAVVGALELEVVEPKLTPSFSNSTLDFVALTPAQARAMSASKRHAQQMEQWKALLLGGAPVQSDWLGGLSKKLKVYESFGMTETISHFAVRQVAPILEDVFQCLPGIEVSSESNGALNVQLPNQAIVQTNDAVEIVNSRTFRWLGRLDDVINTGGVKVHPSAISALLSSSIAGPFVVYGRPHEGLGEEVVLRIHAHEEPQDACQRRIELSHVFVTLLPRHHAPRSIEWKPMEKTLSGKWKRPQ
jgi:O-succinylbenzoic acid--CoA ligase